MTWWMWAIIGAAVVTGLTIVLWDGYGWWTDASPGGDDDGPA